MDPRKYVKSLIPIAASVLAAIYVGVTGGDADQIQQIAGEWELVIGGIVTAVLTYLIPNKAA